MKKLTSNLPQLALVTVLFGSTLGFAVGCGGAKESKPKNFAPPPSGEQLNRKPFDFNGGKSNQKKP